MIWSAADWRSVASATDSDTRIPALQRWRTLDRLLRVAFGLISPAYLFDSFPRSNSGNPVEIRAAVGHLGFCEKRHRVPTDALR